MDANAGGFDAPGEKKGMGTLGKLAIGCGAVLLLCCVGLSYCGVKLVQFGKEVAANLLEVEGAPDTEVGRLLALAASENPFEEPAAPAAAADRIEKFLLIRERVYPRAKGLAESAALKEEKGVGPLQAMEDFRQVCADWAAIRQEVARAFQEEGMGQGEYVYLFRLLCLSDVVEVERDLKGNYPLLMQGIKDIPEEVKSAIRGYEERLLKLPVTDADCVILGWGAAAFKQGKGVKKF